MTLRVLEEIRDLQKRAMKHAEATLQLAQENQAIADVVERGARTEHWQTGGATVPFLVGMVLIAVLAAGTVQLFQRSSPTSQAVLPTTQHDSASATSTPRPTQSPTPLSAFDTTRWNTYTSSDVRYVFRYPPSWALQPPSEGCGPVFRPNGYQNIWLTICGPNISQSNAADSLASDSIPQLADSLDILVTRSTITVDGHRAVRQEVQRRGPGYDTRYNVELQAYVENVAGLPPRSQKPGTLSVYLFVRDPSLPLSYARQTFDQILSSFKFNRP